MQRVERHVCFDLKAFDEDRICFDKSPAKRAISAHNIDQLRLEEPVNNHLDQSVSHVVERALVFVRIVSTGVPIADYHICNGFDDRIDQINGLIGRIS